MKKIFKTICIIILMFFVIWVFDDEEEEVQHIRVESDETWSVLLYLCGSDLESDAGLASDDFEEIMSVEYPENINIIV